MQSVLLGREGSGRKAKDKRDGRMETDSTAKAATKMQLYVDYGYGMSVAVP